MAPPNIDGGGGGFGWCGPDWFMDAFIGWPCGDPFGDIQTIAYNAVAAAVAAVQYPTTTTITLGAGDTGTLTECGGFGATTLQFGDAQTAGIAVGICTLQPELCVAVGIGAAVTIVVSLPQIQTLINEITNAITRSGIRFGRFPTVQDLQTNCTATAPPVIVPSTRRGNRDGGQSIEQEYVCSDGNTWTVYTVVDKNGNVIDQHVRPGAPKYGR